MPRSFLHSRRHRRSEITVGKARRAIHALPTVSCVLLSRGHYRFRTKYELGIAELPHLRYVKTFELCLRRDPVPDEELDRQVDAHADCEHHADQRGDTHELSDQLAGIAVEQACDRACHAVPASSVVARAVSKE